MKNYRVCVIGGWCGNRMVIVAEHVAQLLANAGYSCRVSHHSVWENYSQPPPEADLLLQLLPAFGENEASCPIISIRPMLLDLDHPPTIERIFDIVHSNYPI